VLALQDPCDVGRNADQVELAAPRLLDEALEVGALKMRIGCASTCPARSAIGW
jgi:hypothetical protein